MATTTTKSRSARGLRPVSKPATTVEQAREAYANMGDELDTPTIKDMVRLDSDFAPNEAEQAALAKAQEQATAFNGPAPKAPKGKAKAKAAPKRAASLIDHIEGVLRASDGPMHVTAILDALKAKRQAPSTKDPRDSIVQATFAHGGTGKQADSKSRLVKTAPGTYDVRELNPRGAEKRPAKKAK